MAASIHEGHAVHTQLRQHAIRPATVPASQPADGHPLKHKLHESRSLVAAVSTLSGQLRSRSPAGCNALRDYYL